MRAGVAWLVLAKAQAIMDTSTKRAPRQATMAGSTSSWKTYHHSSSKTPCLLKAHGHTSQYSYTYS